MLLKRKSNFLTLLTFPEDVFFLFVFFLKQAVTSWLRMCRISAIQPPCNDHVCCSLCQFFFFFFFFYVGHKLILLHRSLVVQPEPLTKLNCHFVGMCCFLKYPPVGLWIASESVIQVVNRMSFMEPSSSFNQPLFPLTLQPTVCFISSSHTLFKNSTVSIVRPRDVVVWH